MYIGSKGIIIVDKVFVTISWNSWNNPCKTWPFPLFLSADIPSPIINAKTIAAVTSTIGASGIVKYADNIPASGSPICDATLASINAGNTFDATRKAIAPATIVEP